MFKLELFKLWCWLELGCVGGLLPHILEGKPLDLLMWWLLLVLPVMFVAFAYAIMRITKWYIEREY
jgi:hypothetical protein